tara:strand:- start:11101 stop:24315 length:13215 start_codon:yes stop_codon:yes gene_type:complete
MPDGIFEFKGQEVLVGNTAGVSQDLPAIIHTPLPNLSGIDGGPGEPMSFQESFKQKYNKAPGGNKIESIPLSSISTNKRFKSVFIGSDPEEMHAQQQSWTEKAYNDTLKFGSLVGTTIAGGFGMVYGAGSWALGGNFSDIWSNPIMQGLDKINKEIDVALPNYYTEAEKNAEWYSPDNWMTANFLFDKVIKNSGFAVGAMLSGNIANGLIGSTGASIGSLAARGAAASVVETGQAFKLFTPLLRGTARAFSVGENVAAANVLRSEISSIADIASKSTNLLQIEKQAAGFAKFNNAARRTAIAAYSSAGESSFEALQTSNEFRDKLLNDYFNKNGKNAEGSDLEKIDSLSRRVGKMSFLSNMAVLTVTEFQQLPYLAGSSYKKTRQAANEALGKVDNAILKEGKYVSAMAEAAPTTRFGKVYKGITNTAGALVKGKTTYLFDPKESFQELLQYAIQTGTENYYNKAYKGVEAENIIDGFLEIAGFGLFGRDAQGKGVGALVSKEGLESALIGGLTGGLMQARGKYSEKQEIKEHTKSFLNELNNSPTLKQTFVDKIDAVNRAVELQKDHETAVLNNDKLESVEAMTDLTHNYLAPRIKYGKFDMVMQDLNDLKASAMEDGGQGLEILKQQGIGNIEDTVESFTKRITDIQEKAKTIQNMYEYMNLNYSGQTIIDANGKQSLKYSPEVIDKLVYATTKIADYDKRLPKLAANLSANSIPVDAIVREAIKENKVDLLNESLETIRNIDDPILRDSLEQELLDSVDLGLRRKKFINELNDILALPENYKQNNSKSSSKYSEEELLALPEGTRFDEDGNAIDAKGNIIPKPSIKIKTKNGERNIEIGTEYFLGRVTEYSKDGKEVYRSPKITILGENEDGTIKIKTSNGTIRDISKEELLDYSLSKVSSLEKNRVAKYYFEHQNSVFEFYGKKITNAAGKRVPVRGRLEYEQTEDGLKDKIFFVYKDEKGKIVRKEIDGSMVEPKKGYKHAILKHIGDLSPAQQKAEQEFSKTTSDSVQAKLQRRAEVLNELYEEVLTKKENTEKLIAEKTAKLEVIRKEVSEIRERVAMDPGDARYKAFKFKRTISEALKNAMALSKMERELEEELEELYTVKDEIDLNAEYIEDLIDNMELLPDSTKEFMAELNEELIDLHVLAEETGKQINMVSSLMSATRDAIKSAIKYLTNLIGKFEARYPNVPNVMGQGWVDFLKENPNFLKLKPNYKEELSALELLVAESEDFNIKPNETRLEDLEEHLDILQGALKDYEKQIKAKEAILTKLEEIANKYQEQRAEEKELLKNEKLIKEFIGTHDASKQIVSSEDPEEKVYEVDARKTDFNVVGSTRPLPYDRPYIKRANRFGARFGTFSQSKQKKIKGRIITQAIEGLQGLNGLASLIANNEANSEDVITLVMMVANEDGTYSLADEFGEPLTAEQLKTPLEHIITQVFPSDSLQGKYSGKFESMFRDADNPARKTTIDELTKQYREWRKQQLAIDELYPPKDFKTSFGIPQYVKNLVEKVVNGKTIQVEEIDYTTTTPVEKTGLVSKADLTSKKVITVSQSDSVSEGSVTFATKPGRVFLSIANGLIKLNNRKLNKTEATSIYEAILQLSKIAKDKKTIKDDDQAQQIVRWLKTIVYWGIAKNTQTGQRKDAGYNNVWFEEIKDENDNAVTKLFISGLGGNMSFTPLELAARKNEIITLLSSLYHNVNATQANDNAWSIPYTQITGFDKEGNTITKEWLNYQTYLLSEEGRKEDEIPLTTIVRPSQGENDVVKTGVYFTLNETADNFNFEQAKPAPVVAKETAPVVTPPPVVAINVQENPPIIDSDSKLITVDETSPLSKYKMDGKTPHIFKTKLGNVMIIIDKDGEPRYNEVAGILDYDTVNTIEAVETAFPKETEVATKAFAYNTPLNKIRKITQGLLAAGNIPVDNVVTAAPVVSQPTTEEAVTQTNPIEVVTDDPFSQAPNTNGISDIDKTAFRRVINEAENFPTENFDKLEQWLKAKLPNIPVYRVKNIIQSTNGEQAWGMFHKGAIYLYENAEQGTAFHEVFEAVWAMMTSPSERNTVAKDFRNREGNYVDRFTGETVVYKNATDDQMREELAEEFREYVLYNKNPKQAPKPKTPSFLRKIFDDIINAFKAFFIGDDSIQNTKELFDRIGNGYYKKYIPEEQKLSFANVGYIDINEVIPDNSSVFSRVKIENLSATDIHQIMQQMTYTTITQMIGNNESLFNITSINREKMYDIIKDDLLNRRIKPMADQVVIDAALGKITEEVKNATFNNFRTLYNNVANQWPILVKKHEEYLQAYNIVFDENDDLNYDEYEKSKDEGYGDARQIDAFKKLNTTIKLLLSSLSETKIVGNKTESVPNNIGGITLVPLGSVYVDLLNQLHNSIDQTDMINKFREAARQNPNYRSLFQRMFKIDAASDSAIDYLALDKSDLRIIDGFWKTFKKQAPTVSALFILGNGEIVVGDSNTSGAVRENRKQFINAIIEKTRELKNPYIAKHATIGWVPTNNLLKLEKQTDLTKLVSFLNNIGIEFSIKQLEKADYDTQNIFRTATNGIIQSLKDYVTKAGLEKINAATLNISGRLLELGIVKAKIETSDFETTYFNINGERSQTFLGPNLLSSFYDVISKVENINDLASTNFAYLLTDSFAEGSVVLKRVFDENGKKREGLSIETLKPYIVDGTINEELGKNTESSKLNKRQRYLQEINMNIDGIYMNLVPGDGNMQSAIKLHNKENPFVTKDMLLSKSYLEIFKDYFLSEIKMSQEANRKVAAGRDNTQLRFFKSILEESLYNKIIKKAKNLEDASSIYDSFKKEINENVEAFITKKTEKSLDKLQTYNIVRLSEDSNYSVENISAFNNDESYSLAAISSIIKLQQINFMLANIELHKVVYSDPYQYTDELKRIKNFTSPRQILSYGNDKINTRYDELYNNHPGDTLFNINFNRDTINGATISDINSYNEELNYEPFNETDGGGILTDKGNKYIKIKNGEWTDENEAQYVYDMAFMKKVLNKLLSPTEKEALQKGNPEEQSNYTPLKPIVAGNKGMGRSYNDIVLDKFALFPISFRMIYEVNPKANMLKLYEKMLADNVDYVVYQSGRKVGSENVYSLYDEKGNFNSNPIISEEEKKNPLGPQTVLSLPLSIFAIQTEVPTKEDNQVTQGTQPTKLATMDYMQAGVPIDFMADTPSFETRYTEWIKLADKSSYNNGDNLYNELKNNQDILEARIENGLDKLFKKLGITALENDKYSLAHPELTFTLLKQELLKREINDNIIDALDGYEDGKFVLEAIPSYQQIRNILYSIAHKSIVSPKINGGQKVQVSSALLESQRAEAVQVTDSKGRTKTVYKSDILRFYTNADGKRTCQIMIQRWFKSPLSDQELIHYFNNTEEGKKQLSALAGVAFRVPTQKQNSIEVFEIAKFLPQGFGDSVVIPSALVMKTGSDFDIDKLFMYLKNLYTSKNKSLKVFPYFGIGQQALDKISALYDKGEFDEYIKTKKNALPEGEAEDRLFKAIFSEQYEESKQEIVNDIYRKSLDNGYIDSLEKLISNPLNFNSLVKPNSAQQMKDLTEKIEDLLGSDKVDYSNIGDMLDREFMSELRHDFVTGKYSIGIAAVAQTGNAQAQRTLLTVDASKLNVVPDRDKQFLGDVKINFPNYNSIGGKPTLSMIEDANENPNLRNYISDIIGQMIDGYVDVNKDPWIMRLGITPNVAGTWLFLIRTGVPLQDIAFFMNQPIIREFLQTLQNNGYSYVFNTKFINAVKEDYEYDALAADNVEISTMPTESELENMIGNNELSPYQSLQQMFILDEFLKYSKMAEHLLIFTQATNFDTATFNDPLLIWKKAKQIEKARKTIFSDVDEFLGSSFIGKLKDALDSSRNGLAEVLLSDKRDNPNGASIRSVLEATLEPYAGMSDKDFISIAKKAVLTLFDWSVQTNTKINSQISKVLIPTDDRKSVASQMMLLKKAAETPGNALYDNYILKSLAIEKGQADGEVDNLYITAKSNKVYDQNQIIYAFREIKKLLPNNQKELYGNLVRLAVLQSGLANSRLAFTQLLPFEDFLTVYNDTLSQIDKLPNLSDFVAMNVFERMNYSDTNIVPMHKERVIITKTGRYFKPETTMVNRKLLNPMTYGKIPKVVNISKQSLEGKSEVITFIWSDMTVSKGEKQAMVKRGDYSFMKKGLFKKVYGQKEDGTYAPIVYESSSTDKKTKKTVIYQNYVYKMINAWGDSLYAREAYGKLHPEVSKSTISRESVIENGYVKVDKTKKELKSGEIVIKQGEVEDNTIIEILGNSAYVEGDDFIFTTPQESISLPSETPEAVTQEEKVKVDNSTLKDGDVVYDKLGTKFIFKGLRQPGQAGAGSPRLERTDGTGEIAIPGANIELFKSSIIKPDSITQEEWGSLSQEEQNEIIRQQKEC